MVVLKRSASASPRPLWCLTVLALLIAVSCNCCHAQAAPEAKLEFDVASVRENRTSESAYSNVPLRPGPGTAPADGLFIARNMYLLQFLVFAYADDMYQIQELRRQLPDWAASSRFDISARAEIHTAIQDLRVMMRSLLEERFGVAVHHENKNGTVLALVLKKPGVLGKGLRPYSSDEPACSKGRLPGFGAVPGGGDAVEMMDSGFPLMCDVVVSVAGNSSGPIGIGGRDLAMQDIAHAIGGAGNITEYPVVDKTNLEGKFDFVLRFRPGSLDPSQETNEVVGQSIDEAAESQLGIKLVTTKGTYSSVVIDKLHKLTEN